MKNLFYTLSTLVLASIAVIGCSKTAEANVGVMAGYQNNNVVDEQGLVLDVSAVTNNNIKLGVNTLTQVQDSSLLTYGVYAGVPVTLQNSLVTVTPSIGVDRYRVEEETVGNVALNFDYKMDTTTYATIQTKYSKELNSSEHDLEGSSYTFGITKLF